MANNDILQYLRKTPHNTNVNVVKGMIGSGSGSGAIEMETVFDEDITFTYSQGDDYNPAAGVFNQDKREIILSRKYAKITLDDMTFKGLPFDSGDYISISETNPLTLSLSSNIYTFLITVSYYESNTDNNSMIASVFGSLRDDPDLQAYCQTPHHLKIELFNL